MPDNVSPETGAGGGAPPVAALLQALLPMLSHGGGGGGVGAAPSVAPAPASVSLPHSSDLLDYRLGILPPQPGISEGPGTAGSSPAPLPLPVGGTTPPTGPPPDPLAQKTQQIEQSASGPLKQAVTDYSAKTGGRSFVRDLVLRYAAAPSNGKGAVLQEAANYGIASTVRQLGDSYSGIADAARAASQGSLLMNNSTAGMPGN